MGKKIKQIDINEALERTRKGEKVYVIMDTTKPIIKLFSRLDVGTALSGKNDYIYVVFEEVSNEN